MVNVKISTLLYLIIISAGLSVLLYMLWLRYKRKPHPADLATDSFCKNENLKYMAKCQRGQRRNAMHAQSSPLIPLDEVTVPGAPVSTTTNSTTTTPAMTFKNTVQEAGLSHIVPVWMTQILETVSIIYKVTEDISSHNVKVFDLATSEQVQNKIDRSVPVLNLANENPSDSVSTSHRMSAFAKLGHSIFENLISSSGGKTENFWKNLTHPTALNPSTQAPLKFDTYFDDGFYKIAVAWQGTAHLFFPNHLHKYRQDFLRQREQDQLEIEYAKLYGIHLIQVPITVDRCVSDEKEANGYRFDVNISEQARILNIRNFIIYAIAEYYYKL
jgi:hypothetical protein